MNMNEYSIYDMANGFYNLYLNKENIKNPLPIKNIRFVDDLPSEVLKAQPEIKKVNGFDAKTLQNYSGYTLLYPDNTAEILIDLDYAMQNNFLWCGTLIHEITHVVDYVDYIGILNYGSFNEMLHCLHFWYWTEFHAKYKGCEYMLNFAGKLPDEYKNRYKEYIMQCINDYSLKINKKIDYRYKIYDTVHMIGEILAFEQSSIAMPNKFYSCLTEKFDWFEDTRIFLSKHTKKITVDEMILLSLNLTRILSDDII